MKIRVATVIIEPHLLVREALDALMERHSYRVVCGLSSIAEIGGQTIAGNGPKLVILCEPSIDGAISGVVRIRQVWPDCKIVLLFEYASADDVQNLLESQIDGFVPLGASPDALIRTLDMVVSGNGRVMVLPSAQNPIITPTVPENARHTTFKSQCLDVVSVVPQVLPLAKSGEVPSSPIAISCNGNGSGDLHAHDRESNANGCAQRRRPRLSDREAQILDGLVKGNTNKVIARTYEIAEATVKVHMKSILRKIQVANRTQAAIWALEHGNSTDEIKDRLQIATED